MSYSEGGSVWGELLGALLPPYLEEEGLGTLIGRGGTGYLNWKRRDRVLE